MIIGIDIDDTITKTTEQIDIFAKEYTEKILKREFSINFDTYNPMWAMSAYGWSKEEDREFWNLYYVKVVENVEPKDNSIEVINELFKDNEIIIISARWDWDTGIIQKKTKEWLDNHGFKYHKLFMGHIDKREICNENNINLFIDDSLKTCEEIESIGIKTLLMESRRTKEMDTGNISKVKDWLEVRERLLNKEV